MGLLKGTLLALSLALIACTTKKPDEPAVAQAPIVASDNFADKQDKAIERAAGYVKVAKDVNAKAEQTPPTKTVGVLLEAAESYLDKPNQKNIDHALALAGDHSRLAKVKEDADKTLKEVNAAWEKVVKDAERRRVEAESNLAKAKMELDAAAKREQDNLLGMLGAGLIALGALSLIFGHWVGIGKMGAIGLMVAGAGTAALPRLFDSPEFQWISLGFVAIAAIQALVYMTRRLWGAVRPVDKPAEPPQDQGVDS
jgi:hypothetical protein